MVFYSHGTAWDTALMTPFDTGDSLVHKIYLSRDHSAVFVESVDPLNVSSIRRADVDEIDALAARYGIADLQSANPPAPREQPPDQRYADVRLVTSDVWIG